MRAVAVVAALVLTLLAFIVGLAKVQRLPASLQVRDRARISAAVWTISGWMELVAAAGLVLGVFVSLELALTAAALLLIGYVSLAIRQLSQKLNVTESVPALALSVLAALTVASIFATG
jgi:hypothetical protein